MSERISLFRFTLSLVFVLSSADAFSTGLATSRAANSEQNSRRRHGHCRRHHHHHEAPFSRSSACNRRRLLVTSSTTECRMLPPDLTLSWSGMGSVGMDPHIVAAAAAAIGDALPHQAAAAAAAAPSMADQASIWLMLLPPLLLSPEIFDGSSIVDPVVVSNSYWNGLQRQVFSLLIGQLLAGVTFTLLATLFARQLSDVRDRIVSSFLPSEAAVPDGSDSSRADSSRRRTFVRADEIPSGSSRFLATDPPDYGRLLVCLLIDVVGSSSELVPLLGELTDVVTAPIAAALLQRLFGGSRVVFFLELGEEILPFTDIIPFATICWVVDTYYPTSDVAGVLQLGVFKPSGDGSSSSGGDVGSGDDGVGDDRVIDTSARPDMDSSSSSSSSSKWTRR